MYILKNVFKAANCSFRKGMIKIRCGWCFMNVLFFFLKVNLQMELTSEMGGLCGAKDVVGE